MATVASTAPAARVTPVVLAASDADAARSEARRILADQRFHDPPIPRPFKGALERLGELLAPIGEVIASGFRWLAERLPGGDSTAWVLVGAATVAVAAIIAARLARRRGRSFERRSRKARAPVEDPGALERSADEAEAAGDLERAIRLRFRAGLLRLDRVRALEYTPSLTTGQAARILRSPTFDALGRSFDEIAYGRRPARSTDVEIARTQWPRVLAEMTAR